MQVLLHLLAGRMDFAMQVVSIYFATAHLYFATAHFFAIQLLFIVVWGQRGGSCLFVLAAPPHQGLA